MNARNLHKLYSHHLFVHSITRRDIQFNTPLNFAIMLKYSILFINMYRKTEFITDDNTAAKCINIYPEEIKKWK